MMWRRTTGVAIADGIRAEQVTAFLSERRILSVVETSGASSESIGLTVALDADDRAAILTGEGRVAAGADIADVAQELADAMNGEVSFGDRGWVGKETRARGSDPFEQALGADIAAYADRALVFTRAPERGLIDIASQVGDVVYAVAHLNGHAVCITEGPILTTLDWEEDTRPALIIEYGAAAPSVTVIRAAARVNSSTKSGPTLAPRSVTDPDAGAAAFAPIAVTRSPPIPFSFIPLTKSTTLVVLSAMLPRYSLMFLSFFASMRSARWQISR